MILMLQTTIKPHEIQCYTAEDPEWEVYKSFANRGFSPSAQAPTLAASLHVLK